MAPEHSSAKRRFVRAFTLFLCFGLAGPVSAIAVSLYLSPYIMAFVTPILLLLLLGTLVLLGIWSLNASEALDPKPQLLVRLTVASSIVWIPGFVALIGLLVRQSAK